MNNIFYGRDCRATSGTRTCRAGPSVWRTATVRPTVRRAWANNVWTHVRAACAVWTPTARLEARLRYVAVHGLWQAIRSSGAGHSSQLIFVSRIRVARMLDASLDMITRARSVPCALAYPDTWETRWPGVGVASARLTQNAGMTRRALITSARTCARDSVAWTPSVTPVTGWPRAPVRPVTAATPYPDAIPRPLTGRDASTLTTRRNDRNVQYIMVWTKIYNVISHIYIYVISHIYSYSNLFPKVGAIYHLLYNSKYEIFIIKNCQFFSVKYANQ